MALPLLNAPEFETTVPSTKQPIKFRPFLVKEEKVLFMALQGNNPKEMTNAVKNILSTCILTDGFDVTKLALFDVEYLFLKLRGKSVGESVELKLRHSKGECKHVSDVEVNLDDIEVSFPDNYQDKIQLTEEVGIQLKQPGVNQADSLQSIEDSNYDSILSLIADCVVCIYDHNNVYDTFTKQEIIDFLENLSQQQFAKVQDFFSNSPKLSHDISWQCKECGETETITVEGLANFFT